MRIRAIIPPLGLWLTFLGVAPAHAFKYPLSATQFRDAYFLGASRSGRTADFLAQYVRRFPPPKSGVQIAEIEVSTPYKQVVLRGSQAPPGYSEPQAAADYKNSPARFLVRVRINLTPTYSNLANGEPRPSDFWRDFSIRLIQDGSVIAPRKIEGRPLYYYGRVGIPALSGAEVELEFDPAKVASSPARVEVIGPDGRRMTAEFDLARLR